MSEQLAAALILLGFIGGILGVGFTIGRLVTIGKKYREATTAYLDGALYRTDALKFYDRVREHCTANCRCVGDNFPFRPPRESEAK